MFSIWGQGGLSHPAPFLVSGEKEIQRLALEIRLGAAENRGVEVGLRVPVLDGGVVIHVLRHRIEGTPRRPANPGDLRTHAALEEVGDHLLPILRTSALLSVMGDGEEVVEEGTEGHIPHLREGETTGILTVVRELLASEAENPLRLTELDRHVLGVASDHTAAPSLGLGEGQGVVAHDTDGREEDPQGAASVVAIRQDEVGKRLVPRDRSDRQVGETSAQEDRRTVEESARRLVLDQTVGAGNLIEKGDRIAVLEDVVAGSDHTEHGVGVGTHRGELARHGHRSPANIGDERRLDHVEIDPGDAENVVGEHGAVNRRAEPVPGKAAGLVVSERDLAGAVVKLMSHDISEPLVLDSCSLLGGPPPSHIGCTIGTGRKFRVHERKSAS